MRQQKKYLREDPRTPWLFWPVSLLSPLLETSCGKNNQVESSKNFDAATKHPRAEHIHDKTSKSDMSQMSNGPKIKCPTGRDISC